MSVDEKDVTRINAKSKAYSSELQGQAFTWELARAYVPFQTYTIRFEPEEGLQKGTIFPELYRPYHPKQR
ncbi:hypothetical protein SY88_13280 [Clostridiales bacterium PH28_bin88]|nr:hypothetical protein SY88_13280 [Clostridiales bacterium PH28_bin88]